MNWKMKIEDEFMVGSRPDGIGVSGRPSGEPIVGPALLSLSDGTKHPVEVVEVEWALKLTGGLARGDNCCLLVTGVPSVIDLLTATITGKVSR